MTQICKGDICVRRAAQNAIEDFIMLDHTASYIAFVKRSLTPALSASGHTVALRLFQSRHRAAMRWNGLLGVLSGLTPCAPWLPKSTSGAHHPHRTHCPS
jgi:hypothetical protein